MKKIYSYFLALTAVLAMIITTGCQDPKPEPQPEVKTPTVTLAVKQATEKGTEIEATVKNSTSFKYIYYVKGSRPTDGIKWEVKDKIDKDGVYAVTITGLELGKEYTFEAVAANATQESKPVTLDFTVSAWSPLAVSEVKASPTVVSFKCDFLPADCDGFFYVVKQKADYNEKTFLDECIPAGEGQVFSLLSKETGLHRSQEGDILLPETDYVVAVVGTKLNADNVWTEFVGPVVTYDIKTLAFAVGQSAATVTLNVDKAKLAFNGVPATVLRTSTTSVTGYYGGAIKTSELAGTTLDAKVVAWLMSEIPNQGMLNYDDPQPFGPEGMVSEFRFALEEKTEYTLFVVPFDDMGVLGKVVSDVVTTPALAYDGKANVKLAIEATINAADIEATLNDGCVKAAYVHNEKGALTLEDATTQLLGAVNDQWAPAFTPSNPSVSLDYLNPDTQYVIYVLPVGDDGKLGAIQTIEFKTEAIDFSGAAKMTFVASAPTFNADSFDYVVEYTFTYTDGATHCEYVLANPAPDTTPSAEELARESYLGGMKFKKVTENPFKRNYGDYNTGQHALFVPIDADGKRGAPVSVVLDIPANPEM